MKCFFALCCFLATVLLFPGLSAAEWLTDFQKAKAESLKTGRPIYILFTNSDAAACLSLERTIFSQKKFQDYAEKKLVLMKVDFPVAIHRQPKALRQQNEELKKQYGIAILPTVLLLNPEGTIYVDFVKAAGSQEKHRRKMNEIMDFDPPKRYTEYVDGFVKKYQYTPPEPPKEEAKPVAKAPAKKPAKKPEKKPEKKPDAKTQDAPEDTIIPDENGGIPLVPIDPEGNFHDWLKATTAEETAKQAEEAEKAKETVEEERESIEAKEDSVEEQKQPLESAEDADAAVQADAAKTDEAKDQEEAPEAEAAAEKE